MCPAFLIIETQSFCHAGLREDCVDDIQDRRCAPEGCGQRLIDPRLLGHAGLFMKSFAATFEQFWIGALKTINALLQVPHNKQSAVQATC